MCVQRLLEEGIIQEVLMLSYFSRLSLEIVNLPSFGEISISSQAPNLFLIFTFFTVGFKELLMLHGKVCRFVFLKCPLDPHLNVWMFLSVLSLGVFLNREFSAPGSPDTQSQACRDTGFVLSTETLLKLELMVRCEKYQRPPLSSSLFMSLGGRGQGLPQLEENTLQ